MVPIVLGIILGDIAEEALQQGLILYDDNLGAMFSTFLQRPICIALLLMMVVSISAPIIMEYRKKKKEGSQADPDQSSQES